MGNMLPELALHTACNSCAATELMESRKKEEGKRDEYMETQAKKPKNIDLQTKTCTHTQSVKFRKSEHAPHQTVLQHSRLKQGTALTPTSAQGAVRAHWTQHFQQEYFSSTTSSARSPEDYVSAVCTHVDGCSEIKRCARVCV